jgi:hypothetical protein
MAPAQAKAWAPPRGTKGDGRRLPEIMQTHTVEASEADLVTLVRLVERGDEIIIKENGVSLCKMTLPTPQDIARYEESLNSSVSQKK